MGKMLDFVVDLVEERVDLGGSQFSESILERWYSAYASQQNVVALQFGSPCPPSFTIIFSWLKSSWPITGLSVLSRSVLSPTLNVSLPWTERVWELSGTFSVFVSITSLLVLSCAFQRWDPYCLLMNVLGLHSFHNGSLRSFWRNRLFVKRINIDLLRTGRFSSILHSSRVITDNGSLRSLTKLDLELVGSIGNF